MPKALVNDDPLKSVAGDDLFVVKTSGGVLVRAVNKRSGFNMVLIRPLLAMRYALGPKIKAIYFYDVSQVSGARWINLLHLNNPKDYSLIDRNASTVSGVGLFPVGTADTGAILNSWDTGDFLYICFEQPAGGIIPDLVTNNANAATLAAQYANSLGFTAVVSLVDNTATGGAALGSGAASATVSGEAITWTPQRDWVRRDLREIVVGQTDVPADLGYWVRLSVSATLDSSVSIAQIYAMAPFTASATAPRMSLVAATEYSMNLDESVGGIEFISVAAADTTVNIGWVNTRQTS